MSADIQKFYLGIMPLTDSDWVKGKCSYKMLTYMSCCIAVIASTVGMNKEILALGDCGYGANSIKEWGDVLINYFESREKIEQIRKVGKRIVEDFYSLNVIAKKLSRTIVSDA
jgi:glycosyltransferase involved in cell wall biosynthesis